MQEVKRIGRQYVHKSLPSQNAVALSVETAVPPHARPGQAQCDRDVAERSLFYTSLTRLLLR